MRTSQLREKPDISTWPKQLILGPRWAETDFGCVPEGPMDGPLAGLSLLEWACGGARVAFGFAVGCRNVRVVRVCGNVLSECPLARG